jgi:hypothetical protein
MVFRSEWLDDTLARKWWHPHVQAELRRTDQLNHGHTTANSVHVALDLPRQIATDLLTFLHSLGDSASNQPTNLSSQPRATSAGLGLRELAIELEQQLRSDG